MCLAGINGRPQPIDDRYGWLLVSDFEVVSPVRKRSSVRDTMNISSVLGALFKYLERCEDFKRYMLLRTQHRVFKGSACDEVLYVSC